MITKTQRALSDVFNVEPQQVQQKPDLVPADYKDDYENCIPLTDDQYQKEDQLIKQNVEDDYTVARNNLRNLIDQSQDLLELAIQTAQATENPKNIDSATKILGQLADLNSRLIDLTSRKQDVLIKTRPKATNKLADVPIVGDQPAISNVTNNTMFVGSTAELAKMLKNLNKESDLNVVEEVADK